MSKSKQGLLHFLQPPKNGKLKFKLPRKEKKYIQKFFNKNGMYPFEIIGDKFYKRRFHNVIMDYSQRFKKF